MLNDCRCKQILETVIAHFDLTAEDVLGRRRRAHEVLARQVAMYLMKLEGGTEVFIGKFFERDHSTVHHAVHSIARKVMRDAELRDALIEIDALLCD